MLTITHLLVGAASVGMAAQTTNPVPILIGAIASLLPDIDISTSPAGRVLPLISCWSWSCLTGGYAIEAKSLSTKDSNIAYK